MSPRKAPGKTPEPSKAKRQKPDWEDVKALYRANVVSLRVIAAQYGIAESYIRKKAKAEGWQRDLADKVRRAAKEKLVRMDSAQDGAQQKPMRTDEEIIDEKAGIIASVVRDHQKTIGRGRNLVLRLIDELDEASENRIEIEEAIEKETEEDKDSKRRNSMLKAVSLPMRAGVMLSLSAAAKNFIALERMAFNMDAEAESGHITHEDLVLASYHVHAAA